MKHPSITAACAALALSILLVACVDDEAPTAADAGASIKTLMSEKARHIAPRDFLDAAEVTSINCTKIAPGFLCQGVVHVTKRQFHEEVVELKSRSVMVPVAFDISFTLSFKRNGKGWIAQESE